MSTNITFDAAGVFDAFTAIRQTITAGPAEELKAIGDFLSQPKNVAAGRKSQEVLKIVVTASLTEAQLAAIQPHLDLLEVAAAEFQAVLDRKNELEALLNADPILQAIDHRKGEQKPRYTHDAASVGGYAALAAPERPEGRKGYRKGSKGHGERKISNPRAELAKELGL